MYLVEHADLHVAHRSREFALATNPNNSGDYNYVESHSSNNNQMQLCEHLGNTNTVAETFLFRLKKR